MLRRSEHPASGTNLSELQQRERHLPVDPALRCRPRLGKVIAAETRQAVERFGQIAVGSEHARESDFGGDRERVSRRLAAPFV